VRWIYVVRNRIECVVAFSVILGHMYRVLYIDESSKNHLLREIQTYQYPDTNKKDAYLLNVYIHCDISHAMFLYVCKIVFKQAMLGFQTCFPITITILATAIVQTVAYSVVPFYVLNMHNILVYSMGYITNLRFVAFAGTEAVSGGSASPTPPKFSICSL
jgi:hypothetical protein